jgi:ferredoxin-NADP reductase
LLLGGGSGVVPLMSMLRHRRRVAPELTMRLIYSVRAPEEVIYSGELAPDAVLAFTRVAPEGWAGHRGRIDRELLAGAAVGATGGAAFVCGSNSFVEAAAKLLLSVGFPAGAIRTERFGPSSPP